MADRIADIEKNDQVGAGDFLDEFLPREDEAEGDKVLAEADTGERLSEQAASEER